MTRTLFVIAMTLLPAAKGGLLYDVVYLNRVVGNSGFLERATVR
ncbi:MAG TPA: hypothetical protein VNS10_23970 [Gemmatimonadaceae bacterium]|jgi:hypothetical protein|nr:hypothetical protein [Gemmatimonadaceae bacterium]